MAEDGENALDYINTHANNEGELTLALRNIERGMKRGLTYERCVELWGIRGHPHFTDFWPVTKWWGDVRWAREQLGLSVADDE